jgi:hypothetical protein
VENNSDQDAASGIAEISILTDNLRLIGVDPWPFWGSLGRLAGHDFIGIPTRSIALIGKIGIMSENDQFPKTAQIAVRYRCLLCVPEEWRSVTVKLAD